MEVDLAFSSADADIAQIDGHIAGIVCVSNTSTHILLQLAPTLHASKPADIVGLTQVIAMGAAFLREFALCVCSMKCSRVAVKW